MPFFQFSKEGICWFANEQFRIISLEFYYVLMIISVIYSPVKYRSQLCVYAASILLTANPGSITQKLVQRWTIPLPWVKKLRKMLWFKKKNRLTLVLLDCENVIQTLNIAKLNIMWRVLLAWTINASSSQVHPFTNNLGPFKPCRHNKTRPISRCSPRCTAAKPAPAPQATRIWTRKNGESSKIWNKNGGYLNQLYID